MAVSSSASEPRAIDTKLADSLLPWRPRPSAMFMGTDAAARVSWLQSPNRSSGVTGGPPRRQGRRGLRPSARQRDLCGTVRQPVIRPCSTASGGGSTLDASAWGLVPNAYPLPSGVTVAHGSLEPLVGVRIPARQPSDSNIAITARIWLNSQTQAWFMTTGLLSSCLRVQVPAGFTKTGRGASRRPPAFESFGRSAGLYGRATELRFVTALGAATGRGRACRLPPSARAEPPAREA